MRILLTESAVGAAAHVEAALRAAGYEIVRCHPAADADDQCVVFRGAGPCPLHAAPIDLVVDVRDEEGPQTARELGAACAARRGVPLVVAGPADPTRFPWSQARIQCASDDVIEACGSVLSPTETVVACSAARAAEVSLRASGTAAGVTVSVVGAAGDAGIFVTVAAPITEAVRHEVADAVRHAVAGRKDFTETPRILVSGSE